MRTLGGWATYRRRSTSDSYHEKGAPRGGSAFLKQSTGFVPHRGIYATSFPELAVATQSILLRLYQSEPTPNLTPSDMRLNKYQRNEEIRAKYQAGASLQELASLYGISFQRVQQIVKHRNH